jgi:hypothetical protein
MSMAPRPRHGANKTRDSRSRRVVGSAVGGLRLRIQLSKPADDVRDVGRDGGQVLGVDGAAFGGDGVGGVGDVAGGGIDDAVGQQLVKLDDLLVVVGIVMADQLAAEHQPVGEVVEGLVAVGDLGDLLAQIRVGQVAQECDGAHGPAEFTESAVEPVLAGAVPESPQEGDRGDPVLPDGDRGAQQVGPVGLEQPPVDRLLAEQRVDVLVPGVRVGPIEDPSCQLRIRGSRSNPRGAASPKAGSDWPRVSAWMVSG